MKNKSGNVVYMKIMHFSSREVKHKIDILKEVIQIFAFVAGFTTAAFIIKCNFTWFVIALIFDVLFICIKLYINHLKQSLYVNRNRRVYTEDAIISSIEKFSISHDLGIKFVGESIHPMQTNGGDVE